MFTEGVVEEAPGWGEVVGLFETVVAVDAVFDESPSSWSAAATPHTPRATRTTATATTSPFDFLGVSGFAGLSDVGGVSAFEGAFLEGVVGSSMSEPR